MILLNTAPEDGGPLNSQQILFCSAFSKMVASVITYPHEVLRTRLQIQKRERATAPAISSAASPSIDTPKAGHTSPSATPRASANHGLLKTITTIASQDGWKGFYRGISINLVRTVPASAVTMLTSVPNEHSGSVLCVQTDANLPVLSRYELIMRRLSA